MVGANQGHNKEVGDILYNKIYLKELNEPIVICSHRTYNKFIDKITKEGLKNVM